MGKQIPQSDYRFTYYSDRKVKDQEAHFQLSEHRLSLILPLYQDSANEWVLAAKGLFQDIDTQARFPDTGGRFPSELWDVSVGLSYRHKFDNGWTGGLAATVGSASDEPFHSVDEMYFRVVGLLRVPQGERNSWIFTLIYASDEEIFGLTVPVPGIAYAWVPSDRFRAVIGFPFSTIQFKPVESVTLDAEYFPFCYERSELRELQPFLHAKPLKPRLAHYLEGVDRSRRRTIDFLVDVNRQLQHDISYVIRLDPGVQEVERTLELASGSCRDTTWLLAQLFRHLGVASRFVSGYLIQLVPDMKALDGPTGAGRDFTDLHAWCEVYLPGAGWIGLDPTSGLLAGEGHIPLACTPEPTSAAPVSGGVEPCEVEFFHEMSVQRIAESPRVMDLGLLYRTLNNHQVDMIAGNSTDGPIAAFGLKVLEDDKHYFPPYQAVPLVREDALQRWPQMRVALVSLAGKISADDMRAMNEAVDGQHRDPADVVREFRERHQL